MHNFIFIFFISIFNLPIYSTPSIGSNYEEVFDDTIPTISELILEKNNIDIENRSVYLGYIVEDKNDCEYLIKLMDKYKTEYLFNVDICNLKSILYKQP